MAVLVSGGGDFTLKTTYEVAAASYLTFVSGRTGDELDAAFGKNNEDMVKGIGLALAMYAWAKGDSKSERPFMNLKICNSLQECFTVPAAAVEIMQSANLLKLINSNTYAKEIYTKYGDTEANISCAVALNIGLSNPESYTLSELLTTDEYVASIVDSADAMSTLVGSATGRIALYNNYASVETPIANSAIALDVMKSYSQTIYSNPRTTGTTMTYNKKCFVLGFDTNSSYISCAITRPDGTILTGAINRFGSAAGWRKSGGSSASYTGNVTLMPLED